MTSHTTTPAALLLSTITAAPAAFGARNDAYDTYRAGYTVRHLTTEYGVSLRAVDDYTTELAVFDEDGLPLVTAVIDLYDDLEAALETLAFVAMVAPRQALAPAQLAALAAAYPVWSAAVELADVRADGPSADLQLAATAVGIYLRTGSLESLFALPTATRKGKSTASLAASIGGSPEATRALIAALAAA